MLANQTEHTAQSYRQSNISCNTNRWGAEIRRRFAPWTAAGRSEGMTVHEGKGGGRAVGCEGELAHDKGYYHSYLGTGGGAIGAEAVLGRGSIPAWAGGLGGGRKRRLET